MVRYADLFLGGRRPLLGGRDDHDLRSKRRTGARPFPQSNVEISASAGSTRRVTRLRRGVGIQIAERVLSTGEEHLEHARIPEQIRIVTQRVIEDAPFAMLANPGHGVIVVVTETAAVAATL